MPVRLSLSVRAVLPEAGQQKAAPKHGRGPIRKRALRKLVAAAPQKHANPITLQFKIHLTELRQSSTCMQDNDFEWDDVKAAENAAKHAVTFDMARDVFKDPFAIDELDARFDYGEDQIGRAHV